MKTKKLLALVLALVMALSCMSLTALAEEVTYSEDITVTIPVTLGDTPETLASKASYSDTENLELIGIQLYSSGNPMESISELGLEYSVDCIFRLKGSEFTQFARKDGAGFQFYAGNASLNGEKATTVLGVSYNDGFFNMGWGTDSGYTYARVRSSVTLNDPTIDQLYDVTVTENQTDVTKVQVSWELSNIQASVTSNKIWDTKNLEWVDDTNKPNGATATNGTAKFTFVNLSSVKMDAEVTFAVAEGFTAITPEFADDNSKITLGTKADGEDVKNNGEITVTVTPDDDDFATLTEDATNVKYGTYTVTIRKHTDTKAKYLRFTANENNSSVTPKFAGGSDLQYRINGGEWTDRAIDSTDAIQLANVGDYVELKGTDCTTINLESKTTTSFVMTGSISASGDVTSITNGIGGDAELAAYCYYEMFKECTSLTTAPALPATTLADGCYASMFYGCTNLTTAPELPATTLAMGCYNAMFFKCTSLTNAPALPATTLTNSCYASMFYGCTNLTTAPKLSATTLTNSCYMAMFIQCTSLTTAPELPAETLADNCYMMMFSGCTSLTTAPELPAETLADKCYMMMFLNCTSLKITSEKPTTGTEGVDYGVIFGGEKVVGDSSLMSMFTNCQQGSLDPATGKDITYYWYK